MVVVIKCHRSTASKDKTRVIIEKSNRMMKRTHDKFQKVFLKVVYIITTTI